MQSQAVGSCLDCMSGPRLLARQERVDCSLSKHRSACIAAAVQIAAEVSECRGVSRCGGHALPSKQAGHLTSTETEETYLLAC